MFGTELAGAYAEQAETPSEQQVLPSPDNKVSAVMFEVPTDSILEHISCVHEDMPAKPGNARGKYPPTTSEQKVGVSESRLEGSI